MESVSVNLDALLVQENRIIGEMSIKHYRFPDVPVGSYRIFFDNEQYQDVQADNASHAFQLVGRGDIARIVNLKFAYTHILDCDVIHPSGETVTPSLAHDAGSVELVTADVDALSRGTFEMLDFNAFAELCQTKT